MEKLVILSNEKASKNNLNEYHCINLDLKILPDELSKHYEVECIFRKSNKQENNKFSFSEKSFMELEYYFLGMKYNLITQRTLYFLLYCLVSIWIKRKGLLL